MDRDLHSWLLSPGDSLKQQLLHSGVWASLLNGVERGLQLVKLVILSSILVPSSFGLLGIALITITATKQFSKLGFQEALIYHSDDNVDNYLNTVWIVKLARGLILAVVVFAVAGPVSSFFSEPRAKLIIWAVSLAVLLEGFINPAVIYYQKDLEFHKEFLYKMSGTVSDFVVAVGAALLIGNVWALVYGLLAKRVMQLIVSHLLTGYTVSLQFKMEHARELFNFGRWVSASSIMYFLVTTGDDAFVGWYLGAAALGVYQIGFRLSNAPATEIAHVVGTVLFPAVSKIQSQTDRVARLFFYVLFVVAAIAIPMATGTALMAPEFTAVVLGDQWRDIIPVLQILSVAGLFRALTALTGPIYRGVGVPEWNAYENLIRLGVIVLTIWPLTERFGVSGTALSVTVAIVGSFCIGLIKLRSLIGISLRSCLQAVAWPVVASGLMAVAVIYTKSPTAIGIAVPILLGVVVYGVAIVPLVRFSRLDTSVLRETVFDR